MNVIRQSMLVRDTANNIYTALTAKEDIAQWWGLVNPEADGLTTWYGMDRTWPVPIVAMEPDRSLTFAFDAHHPYDVDRTEPTQITFSIQELGNASMVTVLQRMFSDDRWNTLIHDGWVYSLLSLQLWVERGIAFRDYGDTTRYTTISKTVALHMDAYSAWQSLTNGPLMSEWLEADVHSDPQPGGQIAIRRNYDDDIGGEWVLLSEPRNLVSHWWNATSLAERDDPGLITVQMWTILPAHSGCVVHLNEYGYDRDMVSAEDLAARNIEWDRRLTRMDEISRG